MIRTDFVALAGLAALLQGAPAAADSVSYDPGTCYGVTPAMEDYTTTGPLMAGMKITVVQGGVSADCTWGVLPDDLGGFERGGVITGIFAVWADGNTWCFTGCAMGRIWQFGTQPINQVSYRGASAGIVFDLTTPTGDFGTPGSAQGYTFLVKAAIAPARVADAVYRHEVSVGAAPRVGDLYTTLEVNFPGRGLFSHVSIGADTDQIPATAVPEPGTLGTLAAGVLWLGPLHRHHVRLT